MSAAKLMRLAMAHIRRTNPDETDIDLLSEWAADLLAEWHANAAAERAEAGVEDTPCIESCDRWGTGEGRYHGVIA